MNQSLRNRPLEFSQQLYQRLLTAYPRAHREEYGGAMLQLFRDQCRDAWREGRARGLALLWLRIVPDLVKTSLLERFASFKPGKFMADKLNHLLSPRQSPSSTFYVTFALVFLVVFASSLLITLLLPETYASTARIMIGTTPQPPADGTVPFSDPYFVQNSFQILESKAVLTNVVNQFGLNEKWGKRYNGGETLKTEEAADLLRERMELKTVRDTRLVAITVYSEDRKEAADLANGIAEAYQHHELARRQEMVKAELQLMQEQFQAEEDKIHTANSNLDYLREKLGVPDWNPNDLSPTPMISGQMLQNYHQQKIDGEKQYEQLQTQLVQLKTMDIHKLREVLPTITGDTRLSDLMIKLETSEQTLATLTNDYALADMHIARVKSMVDTLNSEIDDRVSGIMAGLESDVASKKAALDAMEQAFARTEINDEQELERGQPYWTAKREFQSMLDLHKIMAAKIEQEKLEMAIPGASLVPITDDAEPSNVPAKPNKPLNLMFGAIAGFLLGGVCGVITSLMAVRRIRRRQAVASGVM